MLSIENFKREIEKGKQGVFYGDNFLEILKYLKENELTQQDVKNKFISISISLFLKEKSKK